MKVFSTTVLLLLALTVKAQSDTNSGTIIESITTCEGLSTCFCRVPADGNSTLCKDAWFIGGSTIMGSVECQAWCETPEVCGPGAGAGYSCEAIDDPNYEEEKIRCTEPGTCSCQSDTSCDNDTPQEDAFTVMECTLKCETDCGTETGVSFLCVAEASDGGNSIAVNVAWAFAVATLFIMM